MHSDPLAVASNKPDIEKLLTEFRSCFPSSGAGMGSDWADRIRFSIWEGQNEDGKKHGFKGKEAFPWEGASDSRSMLVDGVIVENVGVLVTAFWNAMVKSKMAWREGSSYGVALADHWINECMAEDLVREVELAAQYRETYGWFVLAPTWEQQVTLKRKVVSLSELAVYASSNAQSLGIDINTLQQWSQIIMDPSQDATGVEILKVIWNHYNSQSIPPKLAHLVPTPSDAKLKRALKELREKSETEVVYADLSKNGPQLVALKPYEEVWIPPDATEPQKARVIFRREYITEAELRARVRTDDYDEKWVEEVKNHRGQGSSILSMPTGTGGSVSQAMQPKTHSNQVVSPDGSLCEVIHAYHRAVDEDNVPGVYVTTFSPAVTKDARGNAIYAKHELVDYPHGEYPFVGGAREHWCRRFTSSRGVPEIIFTHQNRDKALDDALIDRTSVTVLPPVNVYDTPLGSKYKFGPAIQNKVLPGREPQFMQVPDGRGVSDALVAKEHIQSRVENYFGMMSEKVPPQRVQTVQAKSVGSFLLAFSKAFQQLVCLGQAYLTDEEFADITGAPSGWLESRRSNPNLLQSQLKYDVRELDPEMATKRIEAMNQVVIPSDVTGVIDRAKWVAIQVRSINPTWGKELIIPGPQASEAMFKGVRDDLAQMYLGNEAKYTENDPAAQQKLQFADQIVASNPNYQQAIQQGGRFAELLQKWIENLKFSMTQQNNKMIGRIGVQPEGMQ